MHNIVKWQNINFVVFTLQDFKSMFGHFTTLCMKGLTHEHMEI